MGSSPNGQVFEQHWLLFLYREWVPLSMKQATVTSGAIISCSSGGLSRNAGFGGSQKSTTYQWWSTEKII